MARGACVGVVNGTADDGGGLLGVDVGDTDVDVEGAMGTGGGSTPSPSAGAAGSVDAVLAVAAPAAAVSTPTLVPRTTAEPSGPRSLTLASLNSIHVPVGSGCDKQWQGI